MSLEQANRYYELAARARQNGRNAIADALLRQAEREKEKAAMDVQDVADIQRERANAQQNIAQPQQNVAQQQAPVQETPAVEQTQSNGGGDGTVTSPAPYKPSAEELANMADSEQFNGDNSIVGNAYGQNYTDLGLQTGYTPVQHAEGSSVTATPTGMIRPVPADQRPIANLGGGDTASSMRIYDPDVFAGAPPEGDEVWNTPEEQNARLLAQKKKQKEIEELARQAQAAQIGSQYWGNNQVY